MVASGICFDFKKNISPASLRCVLTYPTRLVANLPAFQDEDLRRQTKDVQMCKSYRLSWAVFRRFPMMNTILHQLMLDFWYIPRYRYDRSVKQPFQLVGKPG